MAENRILVFDMDGTIADFYSVEGWLADLEAERTRPYEVARPLYDVNRLNNLIERLKMVGWKIIVTTWLAKGGSKEFNDRTRKAKLEWLEKWGFPYDEIHLVKYGTTKANCTRYIGGYQILIDDNEKVRKGWNLGKTINANKNILIELEKLLDNVA